MKVFISWSGEPSRGYAKVLDEWLPRVVQGVKTFFSHEDIETGTRSDGKLAAELEESNYGIICMTPDTQREPWINYEAGALSKLRAEARVCVVLFDFIDRTQLENGPLSPFQNVFPNKDGIRKLIGDVYGLLKKGNADSHLEDKDIDELFDLCWPKIETALAAVRDKAPPPRTPPRETREIVGDILEIVRDIRRGLTPNAVSGQQYLDWLRLSDSDRKAARMAALMTTATNGAGMLRIDGSPSPMDELLRQVASGIKKPLPSETGEKPEKK